MIKKAQHMMQRYDLFARLQFLEGLVEVPINSWKLNLNNAKKYFDEYYPNRSRRFDGAWLTKEDTYFFINSFSSGHQSDVGGPATKRLTEDLQDVAQKAMMGQYKIFWGVGKKSHDDLNEFLEARPGHLPNSHNLLRQTRAKVLGKVKNTFKTEMSRAESARNIIRTQGGDALVPRPGTHDRRRDPETGKIPDHLRMERLRNQPGVHTNINEQAVFKALFDQQETGGTLLSFLLDHAKVSTNTWPLIKLWLFKAMKLDPSLRGDKYYIHHRLPFLKGVSKHSNKDLISLTHYIIISQELKREANELNRAYLRRDGEGYARLAQKIRIELDGFDGKSGRTPRLRAAISRFRNSLKSPEFREYLQKKREKAEIKHSLGYRSQLLERPRGGMSVYASRKNARTLLRKMMGR